MPTLLDFRRRIRSVKNTQQITRAMKFIAAARLRRAQETATSLRPYAAGIREVLRSAMSRIENPEQFPLLTQRPEERVLVLVAAGERGLAGAFNANVLRRAFEFLREKNDKTVEVIPIAKKSRDAFAKRSWKIVAEYVDVTTRADLAVAAKIAAEVMKIYEAHQADSVYLIYNEFKNVMAQTLRVEKLLPLEPAALGEPSKTRQDADVKATGVTARIDVGTVSVGGSTSVQAGGHASEVAPSSAVGTSSVPASASVPASGKSLNAVAASPTVPVDYIYEQPAAEIFNKLVPRYVEMQIYRMLAETSAAEHAARMTAMDSATRNASDVIDALTLHMNKVRQAAITREIIEVVSGAASAG
jgi:F-type H+-transporting ATPase subunit gamma